MLDLHKDKTKIATYKNVSTHYGWNGSLLEKGVNLALKVVGEKDTFENAIKKLDQCKDCPFKCYNPNNGKCEEINGGCGCFVHVKALYKSITNHEPLVKCSNGLW